MTALPLAAESCPSASVAAPSTAIARPDGASRLRAALLITNSPPLLTVKFWRIRKGVFVPPWANNKVLVATPGALRMRLLMVRVLGKAVAVVTSLLTVLVAAFVIRTRPRPL